MTIYKPYTYLIGWSEHQRYYYGVRYAQGCNPNDFWQTYFTSSDTVKEFREQNGEPDIIQIRKTFDDAETAIKWEYKVLSKIQAHLRKDFLNRAVWPSADWSGKKHTEESKQKIRNYRLGQTHSEETKEKMRKSHKDLNKVCSEETRRKISKANLGRKTSKDTRDKLRKSMLGKKHSEKTKEKLRKIASGMSIETRHKLRIAVEKEIVCPYCGVSGSGPTMQRWHFANCRSSPL